MILGHPDLVKTDFFRQMCAGQPPAPCGADRHSILLLLRKRICGGAKQGLCSLSLCIPSPLAAEAIASEIAGRMHEKSRIPPECSHSPLRRDRDSNPGNSYPFTAFRVRPDRPLRHLSKSVLAFRPQIYYLFHYINMENTFFNIGVPTSPM